MKQSGSAQYLLDDPGLSALRSFIDGDTLLAFDLDGTLAPIVPDPSGIKIPEQIRESMRRLCAMAKVVILSGRGRDDARSFLGFEPRLIVGNHGAEGLPGWEEREKVFREVCAAWRKQLLGWLPDIADGIVLEDKTYSLSLHYRNAVRRDEAYGRIMDAIWTLVPAPERIPGKFVENIIPQGAPRKGRALLEVMRCLNAPRALFVGDDDTDEDVFCLRYERIFGIRVGAAPSTVAEYYLKEQEEVGVLLREISGALLNLGIQSENNPKGENGSAL